MTITIVFDLDGTLIDTAPDLMAALSELLVEMKLSPVDLARAKDFIGHGIRPMIEKALIADGVSVTPELLDTAWQRYLALYTPRMTRLSKPFEGVEKALLALKGRGYRLAVCTNKLERLARQCVEDSGWGGIFDALAGQETYGWRKPDGRHILSVVADAGGAGGKIIMVGDSRPDIEAARDAKVPVIGFAGGYTHVPLEELKPDVIMRHFDELVPVTELLLAR